MYNYCIAAYCSTIITTRYPSKSRTILPSNFKQPQYIFTVRPYKVPRAMVTKAVT